MGSRLVGSFPFYESATNTEMEKYCSEKYAMLLGGWACFFQMRVALTALALGASSVAADGLPEAANLEAMVNQLLRHYHKIETVIISPHQGQKITKIGTESHWQEIYAIQLTSA